MTEVVAVFGVLLAVYTYIDSLYRHSIIKVIEEKGNSKAANNTSLINKLKYQRNYRAVPLLMFSCIVFLLMLPDFMTTLIRSLEGVINTPRYPYSISAATIILVPIIFLYWVVVNIHMMITISVKIKKISVDR
ncbi:MAG TPA: hypothetical protein DDX29_05945 [Clostridiales bacterium]|nr:hypothetical protein [Clostridiales bacterium]